jgi:hypothetical protein
MSNVFLIHVTENGLPLVYFAGLYYICAFTGHTFIIYLVALWHI